MFFKASYIESVFEWSKISTVS